jgi:DNA anti-recombination protein RmuC
MKQINRLIPLVLLLNGLPSVYAASPAKPVDTANQQIVQLNTQIQAQLKQMNTQQQQQIDKLNAQLQAQIKQVQSTLQDLIQKSNTQTQTQIKQVQANLENEMKQLKAQVNAVKK